MSGVRGRPGSGVRLARTSDLDAIMALESAAFSGHDCFPRRAWRRLLGASSALCLVSDGSRTIDAGIAWLLRRDATVARMYSLAVHPRARGRGLARALVAASLARLPRRIATLSLEVRRGNQAAIGLYCSLGFVETALLRRYYPDGGDGLRMRAPRRLVAEALAL